MDAVVLVLYVLAVVRLTRIVNADVIFDPFRSAIIRVFKGSPLAVYLITCPWCMSIWVAVTTSWAPVLFPHNPVVLAVMAALAASTVTGVMSPLTADKSLSAEPDK